MAKKAIQSDLDEMLKRLIKILARQAAREALILNSAPITERADG